MSKHTKKAKDNVHPRVVNAKPLKCAKVDDHARGIVKEEVRPNTSKKTLKGKGEPSFPRHVKA